MPNTSSASFFLEEIKVSSQSKKGFLLRLCRDEINLSLKPCPSNPDGGLLDFNRVKFEAVRWVLEPKTSYDGITDKNPNEESFEVLFEGINEGIKQKLILVLDYINIHPYSRTQMISEGTQPEVFRRVKDFEFVLDKKGNLQLKK